MKKTLTAIALALTFFAAAPAWAADAPAAAGEKYTYDPHTQVLFSVEHMGFTAAHGRFNKIDGSFTLDEKNPESAAVDFTVAANSVDMGSDIWSEHVKEKFLQPEKFPTISFKSTSVKRTGEKTADLTGDLTLHGVTKPVTLHVTLNKVGPHPMMQDQKHAGFSLTGSLKRSDFGITEFIPMVGDDVAITAEVDGMHPLDKSNK